MKKLFEKLFKDSPSAPASASTSNEVIDLTTTGDIMELSMTKCVPEKMIDYPKTRKRRLQRKYLQHDILKVLCYEASKCDITNAVEKSFKSIQAIFNQNVQKEASEKSWK